MVEVKETASTSAAPSTINTMPGGTSSNLIGLHRKRRRASSVPGLEKSKKRRTAAAPWRMGMLECDAAVEAWPLPVNCDEVVASNSSMIINVRINFVSRVVDVQSMEEGGGGAGSSGKGHMSGARAESASGNLSSLELRY